MSEKGKRILMGIMVEKTYTRQYNKLTRVILEKYQNQKTGENIILSPFSIIMLLGIAAASTIGAAREEIVHAIGESMSYEQLMGLLNRLQADFTEEGNLISSNAVCVQESIKGSVSEGYEKTLEETFSGRLFASEDIVSDVNAWVKEKTRGMIDRIADDSTRQMLACLINAAAFEADWQKPYEEEDIYEGEFTNADNSISEVEMLDSMEHTYIENKDFTGFVKPYKDMGYSFMALLPRKKSKVSLLYSLKELNFSELLFKAKDMKVFVTMPEYQYSFSEDITATCKEMGIKTIFSANADFSPMSSKWLKLDAIIHKAHIEVDRKGTKAAAVTEAIAVAGAAPDMDYKSVCLDRPFIYAIIHNDTALPVFCGIMNHAE